MREIIDQKVYDTENTEQIANHRSVVDKGDFRALKGAHTREARVALPYGEELDGVTQVVVVKQ